MKDRGIEFIPSGPDKQYGDSFAAGKFEIADFLERYLRPRDAICDMGAGVGTYYELLGPDYDWTAVEIWHPSAEYLRTMYSEVYEMDIRDFEYHRYYNLVIFGDVLEHLTVEDAQRTIAKAKKHADMIMVAVPYLLAQESEYGNEAERHLQPDLTDEIFRERYPGFYPVFIVYEERKPRYGYYFWLKGFDKN